MHVKFWLILFAAIAAYQAWQARAVTYGAGVVAPLTPAQSAPSLHSPIAFKNYTLNPLADFKVEARVLSAERYRLDRESDLAPVDLAMGWGKMSDERVLANIDIKQSGRFYFWRTQQFPIPRAEIETHSSNMHIIPSNDYIDSQLKKIRKGQVVRIQGYLVEASSKDGWHWRSSLTREDTGNGACELIYAKSLRVIKE